MGVFFLLGPTAVGKSAVAIALAQKRNGEIINADSMQIYRELNIGAAKPTQKERGLVPHHLYDIRNIGQEFSVAEYRTLAFEKINEVQKRHALPIVCGGTGLYFNALYYKMDFASAAVPPSIREKLQQELRQEGAEAMYARLKEKDSLTAQRLHPNDTKRVLRALEIMEISGVPFSQKTGEFKNMQKEDYASLCIGLRMERSDLNHRIDARVDQMLKEGLVEEAEEILKKKIELTHPSMQGIGYKQVFPYLLGEYGYSEMVTKIKTATHQFAKRQMTWFKRDPNITWIDVTPQREAKDIVSEILAIMEKQFFSLEGIS